MRGVVCCGAVRVVFSGDVRVVVGAVRVVGGAAVRIGTGRGCPTVDGRDSIGRACTGRAYARAVDWAGGRVTG